MEAAAAPLPLHWAPWVGPSISSGVGSPLARHPGEADCRTTYRLPLSPGQAGTRGQRQSRTRGKRALDRIPSQLRKDLSVIAKATFPIRCHPPMSSRAGGDPGSQRPFAPYVPPLDPGLRRDDRGSGGSGRRRCLPQGKGPLRATLPWTWLGPAGWIGITTVSAGRIRAYVDDLPEPCAAGRINRLPAAGWRYRHASTLPGRDSGSRRGVGAIPRRSSRIRRGSRRRSGSPGSA